jgi:thiol-disulfide isomerase/thioredoxin
LSGDRFASLPAHRFYAPWCSHCKALAKGYAAAAEAASGKGLSFGKVDCTQNGGLTKRFGIRVCHAYLGATALSDRDDTRFRLSKRIAPSREHLGCIVSRHSRLFHIDVRIVIVARTRSFSQGFPTLKFWRDGHVRSYRHPRTPEGLIEFGALVTAPAVVPVANAAGTLQFFLEKSTVTLNLTHVRQ